MSVSHLRQMDWNLLRLFYFMCQSPTLTEAAKHLHVTQSALSRRLASLEATLGYRLFNRGHRGLTLVPEGQELLDLVSPVFDKFTQYQSTHTQQSQTVQGLLKMLIAPHLPVSWLMHNTAQFLEDHPDLNFSLIQPSGSSVYFIKQADCTIQPFDSDRVDDLIQRPLCKISYGLYASQDYLNKKSVIEDVKDLQHHPKLLLNVADANTSFGWPDAVACDLKSTRIHTFSTAQDVFDATRQGFGIAALPRLQASTYSDLVALPFYLKDQMIDLYYAYPKYHQDLKRVTLYGDFLEQNFKNNIGRMTRDVLSVNKITLAS